MVASVDFRGTRVNSADTNTGWGGINVGGQTLAEPQLRYQGTNAVNKRITATNNRAGLDYDPGSGGLSFSTAPNSLWFCKVYVADFGDLNTTYGVEVRIGSSNGNYFSYNIAGSTSTNSSFSEYPAQGGYLIVPINPSDANYRFSTAGTPALNAVDFFAVLAQFVTGGAKSENLAMDAIDIGEGLNISGTDGTFLDFLEFDQNTVNNRYGVVTGLAPTIECNGKLNFGRTGNSLSPITVGCTFSDNENIVLFRDGFFSPGDLGILIDLGNPTTDITIGASLTGLGSTAVSDTRPVFETTGTAGVLLLSGATLSNFESASFNSSCTINNSTLDVETLTIGGATFDNTEVITASLINNATITTASPANIANLTNMQFTQSGVAGHAIEITSPGTYNFDNFKFSGYGTSASAALSNVSGGLVTINVTNGGDTPTISNGIGATTVINNAVPLSITNIVDGSRLYIVNETDSVVLANVLISGTTSYSDSINFTGNKDLSIRVRNSSAAPFYKTFTSTGTLTSTGFSLAVNQELDQ